MNLFQIFYNFLLESSENGGYEILVTICNVNAGFTVSIKLFWLQRRFKVSSSLQENS